MADTPAQPGATTTLGYLADRSAQLAASLREVEAEICLLYTSPSPRDS